MTVQSAEVVQSPADMIRIQTQEALKKKDKKGQTEYAAQVLSSVLREAVRIKSNKTEVVNAKGQIPTDIADDVKIVQEKLTQLFTVADHIDPQKITPQVRAILLQLDTNLNRRDIVYIAPVVIDLLQQPSWFQLNQQDSPTDTPFEARLRQLYKENESAATVMTDAIKRAADKGQVSHPAEVQARIDRIIRQENRLKEQVALKSEKQKTVEKPDAVQSIQFKEVAPPPEYPGEQNTKPNQDNDREKNRLLGFFEGTEHVQEKRLIEAIYGTEPLFWSYLKGIYDGGNGEEYAQSAKGRAEAYVEKYVEKENKRRQERGEPLVTEDEKNQKIAQRQQELMSEIFIDRVRRLIGELHRTADEQDFSVLWQDAVRRGDPYYNINTMTEKFMMRLSQIQGSFRPPEDVEQIGFHRRVQQERTETVEVKSAGRVTPGETRLPVGPDGKATVLEQHTFIYPFAVASKMDNFDEFMNIVQKSAKTEIGIRRFLHDARALPYLDTGRETSYWQALLQQARLHLDSADIDNYHTLFDSDKIGVASMLRAKLHELEYAAKNWRNLPLTGLPDLETGMLRTDRATLDYLRVMFEELGLKEWEIKRILAAGVGDNFGISLSAITTGAMADPALKEDGTPSLQSYGKKDALIYEVLNFLAHVSLRFDSETISMSGLIWLPIEGESLKQFADNWDFRRLLDEKEKFQAAFVAGKSPDDIDQKILRMVDVINPARVGSIYDQGGWREFYGYEGWLVRPQERAKARKGYDIVQSWKALENIGIEVLKDFIGNIGTLDPSFFRDDEASTAKRRELVSYLYKNYFVQQDIASKTEAEIQNEINARFESLEQARPDKGKIQGGFAPMKSKSSNYNAFFYEVLSRGIAKRLPTKFIRMESERARKVNGLRDRAYEWVYDDVLKNEDITYKNERVNHKLSPHVKEYGELRPGEDPLRDTYQLALQDVAFAEVLLRRYISEEMKEGIEFNGGQLHNVDINHEYDLTPERMEMLWDKYAIRFDDKKKPNEAQDRERKLNALRLLKSARKFAFQEPIIVNSKGDTQKYVDIYAQQYKEGAPYGPPFSPTAGEEMDRSFLAHRGAGLNMPARAIQDIVESESNIVEPLSKFYSTLKKVSISGKSDNDFGEIIQNISQIRSQLSGMHGTEYANRMTIWLAKISIAFFKKNTNAENLFKTAISNPKDTFKVMREHKSLASFLAGGEPGGVWEWDRATIFRFISELSRRRLLSKEPYKSQKTPSFEDVYEVDDNGNFKRDESGDLIKSPTKRRRADFESDAQKLTEEFIGNPAWIIISRLFPYALGLIIAMFVAAAYKGYESGSEAK